MNNYSLDQLLSQPETPEWFNYPEEFLRIVDQGLLDFDPWIFYKATPFALGLEV